MSTLRAVIYTRVSTGEQAEHGTSLEVQALACHRKATELNAQVVGEFADAGVSGGRYVTRRGIQDALEAIESGQANVLIAYKLDRGGRDVDALRDIRKRVEAAGATLCFADGMNFENTATGKLMFTQLAGYAEFERGLIRERTMMGKKRQVEKGRQPSRGMRPYGYHIVQKADVLRGEFPAGSEGTYVFDETEAPHLRTIFARYVAGDSLRGVARHLQEQGVPPPSHAPDRLLRYETPPRNLWHAATVQGILLNPIYKGTLADGKRRHITDERRIEQGYKRADYCRKQPREQWTLIDNAAPALVDLATWEACQARLKTNKNSKSGDPAHRFLFTGLLACPKCGRGLHGNRRVRGNSPSVAYACRDHSPSSQSDRRVCNNRQYNERTLRELTLRGLSGCKPLWDAAFETYQRSLTIAPPGPQDDRERLQGELDALQGREAATVEAEITAMACGRDAAPYRTLLARMDAQKRQLQQEIADLTPPATPEPAPVFEPSGYADVVEQFLADLREVLLSDDVTTAEKNDALAKAIERITPDEADGIEITLRPRTPESTVTLVTVNLAPADVRKAGPSFDLPIAIGLLVATGQLSGEHLDGAILVGELSLDGSVRPVNGALPIAIGARERGQHRLYISAANAREAAIVDGVDVFPVSSLAQLARALTLPDTLAPLPCDHTLLQTDAPEFQFDFEDVKGHSHVKRAFEVAAAGGHNLILLGPPGSGKTMMARRLPSILPPLTIDEALESTKLYSVAGLLTADTSLVATRPFRSPHHTVSTAALVGGGSIPRPGEVSLAHHGVLFLDELPEFARDALEVLRQPLEDGVVNVARVNASYAYPADFTLIAAMNPCPCGYWGDTFRQCACTPGQVQKYQKRISGPLLDRIDLHVEVPRLSEDELLQTRRGESSAAIRERVCRARVLQARRFADPVPLEDTPASSTRPPHPADALAEQTPRLKQSRPLFCNAQMGSKELRAYCTPSEPVKALLRAAIEQLGLSARAYDRLLKVARTIADLEGADVIATPHIAEAIQYRSLDRKFGG